MISSDWRRLRTRGRTAFLLTWLASAAYVAPFLNQGWVPHDEGTIAHTAERVLNGERPHVDYDEPYTGGLTELHAVAFRWLGVRLSSLRIVLFLFFLLFVASFFAIASRVLSALIASLVTFGAVVWSIPNYIASMPSWYNLFFATFCVLAVLKHLESGRRVWLVCAGLSAGLSVLVKIVGLYAVAGIFVFLVYREQVLSANRARGDTRPSFSFLALKSLAGSVTLAALVWLLRDRLTLTNVVHFLIPPAALVGAVLGWESRDGRGRLRWRVTGLLRLIAPFLLGVFVPLIVWLVPYLTSGHGKDLFRALVVHPFRQVAVARMDFPPPLTMQYGLPYAALLGLGAVWRWKRLRAWTIGLSSIAALLLLLAPSQDVYRAIWYSIRQLVVVVVLIGCGWLALARTELGAVRKQGLFLLLCVTAWVSLVQFPFAAPIYFCYVAPLAILAAGWLVAAEPRSPKPLHVVVLAFYVLFALLFNNYRSVFDLGHRVGTRVAQVPLPIDRAGLIVSRDDARVYANLVDGIRKRRIGRWIYAGPDAPEVYFLSDSSNPTRSLFDFQGDLYGDEVTLLHLIEDRGIAVVAINRAPDFSRQFSNELLAELAERFPNALKVGDFVLRWRQ